MNEDNQNNLNNTPGSAGQVPNVQPQNLQNNYQQTQNFNNQQQVVSNPYAQTFNHPGLQNMNQGNNSQDSQADPNNQYNPNPNGDGQNPNAFKKSTNPIKKHGMSVITTLVLIVLIVAVIFGGSFVLKNINGNTNSVNRTTNTVDNVGNARNRNINALKVGAYVQYKPDEVGPYVVDPSFTGQENQVTISQNSNMSWRVFKIDEDSIELIATVPTVDTLSLSGAMGYDNGVYLLNDICKNLFSNSSMNAVGRSINIEDITSKIPEDMIATTGYAPVDAKRTYTGSNAYYPNLYMFENGSGIGKSIQYIEHSSLKENATKDGTNDVNNIQVDYEEIADVKTNGCSQSDSYYTSPVAGTPSERGFKLANGQQFIATHTAFTSNVTTCFTNSEYASMFYGAKNKYWLASRFVNCATPEVANFGIRTVNSNSLEILKMFDSNSEQWTISYSILPIVTIKNYTITSGTGTLRDPIVINN